MSHSEVETETKKLQARRDELAKQFCDVMFHDLEPLSPLRAAIDFIIKLEAEAGK